MKRFLTSFGGLIGSVEAAHKQAAADLQLKYQAELERMGIIQRALMFRDRRADAEKQYAQLVAPIDAGLALDREVIFSQWLNENGGSAGAKVRLEEIAGLLASHDALKREADEFKKFLRRKTIGVAEQACSDYEEQHRDALKGIALEPSEEIGFTPMQLDPLHFHNGNSARLHKAAISRE